MKLHRPYIPLAVRVKVAQRQASETPVATDAYRGESRSKHLARLLASLFGDVKVALDHDPALVNRAICSTAVGGAYVYVPDANDPRYLVYRTKAEHDIKTRVRGDGAQLSDLAIARKRKRKERKKTLAVAPRFWSALHGKYLPGSKPKHRWPKGRKIASRK